MVCSNLKHQKVNWIFYYLHLSDSGSEDLREISRAGLNYSYVFSQFIGARVDLWKRTENLLRKFCLSKGELAIFSGPIYDSEYFFESKHGQIWDYRLFSNNCKHYAQKGLTVGGADVRFLTLAPAEWPGKFAFSWYNPN